MIVGGPLVDKLAGHKDSKARDTAVHIEISDADGMPSGFAVVAETGRAPRCRAGDGLSSGSGFPRRHGLHFVAVELHGLSFHAAGIVADTTARIGNSGRPQKPIGNRVAPDFRLAGLIFELRQDIVVALIVDEAFELLPLAHIFLYRAGAFVV